MKKRRNKKAFTIVELLVVIAVIAILAVVAIPTFSSFISKAQDSKAIQEAKNAYTWFSGEYGTIGKIPEYAIYDADGKFVALQNGAPVGLCNNADDALSSLVSDPNDYVTVQSLTNKLYLVFKIADIDVSDFDKSEFIGKKIACIGDSVTAGVGANPNYVANLGIALNAAPINLGASGTVLCTGGSRGCQFSKLAERNLQDADIVTIYLGVNDWDNAGTNNSGQAFYTIGNADSTDTSTIYGAMKMWCDKIEELKRTERYKNTQFFFITPHLTSWNKSVGSNREWNPNKQNVHGYTQKEMSEAIKAVCNAYGIPVVDIYDYTVKLYNQDPTKYINEYGGDGIHPTAACHKLMTDYILMHFYIGGSN